jgi:hypothetical protein
LSKSKSTITVFANPNQMAFGKKQSSACEAKISPASIRRFTRSLVFLYLLVAIHLPGAEASNTNHWAFQSIKRPGVPTITNPNWARNPIDSFVVTRLNEENLTPSPEAPRSVLIRRLSLDLLGLMPSPEEVEAFQSDCRPDAYERLVDRYLESPHYGERWARHWLDVARYADSGGYEADVPRQMWPYRDWVIQAMNRDMPFDQFVIEQLAGDLLPNPTRDQRIATAFHSNGILDRNLYWEFMLERVGSTGIAFLGLTLGCAQCHTHKTDPVTQREFYELYAFFNDSELTDLDLSNTEEKARYHEAKEKLDARQKELSELENSLKPRMADWETALTPEKRFKFSEYVQMALLLSPDKRSEEQVKTISEAFFAEDAKHKELAESVAELTKKLPVLPALPVMKFEKRDTQMFIRGNNERLGDHVLPGVPAAFHPLRKSEERATRLDLAQWIVAPENPLTARVTVNRIWQRFFGTGLVETENDFGVQTTPPSHPQLLDWLAAEFQENGWSMKRIKRLIVLSSTYRQASDSRPELERADPKNRLLARQRRIRCEAETIRDLSLQTAGLLSEKIGGPSVFPFQPEGVLAFRATKAEWNLSPGEDRYRRGLYTWFWRLTPYPFLVLFDAPESVTTCTRRARSNTPAQALTLLNDPVLIECARSFGGRIWQAAGPNPPEGILYAYEAALGRKPLPKEMNILLNLYESQKDEFSKKTDEAKQVAGMTELKTNLPELAAWTVVARTLMNLDEFITRE